MLAQPAASAPAQATAITRRMAAFLPDRTGQRPPADRVLDKLVRGDPKARKPPCLIRKEAPRWAGPSDRPAAPRLRLVRLGHPTDFQGWRAAARALRAAG